MLAVRDDVAKGSTAKAEFLANISHELRTPVTVAKGIAYVLKNPAVPDEEKTEFLDQLTGSLDKLMGIVDELITLSELERGTFELSLVETGPGAAGPPRAGRGPDALSRDPGRRGGRRRPVLHWPTGRGSDRWSASCWTTPAATRPFGRPWSWSPGTWSKA